VTEDDHPVAREVQVRFEGIDPVVESRLEGGEGVFRSQAPRTAMALEVERARKHGGGTKRPREEFIFAR
jgi:hypothetical protein